VIACGVQVTLIDGTGAVTVIVAEAVALPPGPVHVTGYVVVAVGVTVIDELGATPEIPGMVQLVAFVVAIVSVDELPDVIVAGFALIVTVGTGLTATVTLAEAGVVPLPPGAVMP
jgi:hypothetical protein